MSPMDNKLLYLTVLLYITLSTAHAVFTELAVYCEVHCLQYVCVVLNVHVSLPSGFTSANFLLGSIPYQRHTQSGM